MDYDSAKLQLALLKFPEKYRTPAFLLITGVKIFGHVLTIVSWFGGLAYGIKLIKNLF